MMYTETIIVNNQKILLGEAAHPTCLGFAPYRGGVNRENEQPNGCFLDFFYSSCGRIEPNTGNLVSSGDGMGNGVTSLYNDFLNKTGMCRAADYTSPERTYTSRNSNLSQPLNVQIIRHTKSKNGVIMMLNGDGTSNPL